jgi:Fur family ferric uptake transcriptional regulator
VDTSTALTSFETFLRERHLPVTAARLAVARALFAAGRDLSADDISQIVRDRGRNLGTATIYRTLQVLVQSGLVVERDFGTGHLRYEAAKSGAEGDQMVCTHCGRMTSFSDTRLAPMAAEHAAAHGFHAKSHRFVVYGKCASCAKPKVTS